MSCFTELTVGCIKMLFFNPPYSMQMAHRSIDVVPAVRSWMNYVTASVDFKGGREKRLRRCRDNS